MTPEEFGQYVEEVRRARVGPLVKWGDVYTLDGVGTIGEVVDPRTLVRQREKVPLDARVLLYGYTVERCTFVVAVSDEGIIRMVDSDVPMYKEDWSWSALSLRPNKRAYPDATDKNFALLMAEKDAEITFTTFRK